MSVNKERLEFWKKTIRDCESSGLSIAEYCRANNLSNSKFFKWRKTIRELEVQTVDFIALDVIDEHAVETSSTYDDSISVSCGNVNIKFTHNTDPELMKKLLEVMNHDS